jgi:pimeloyl-ACP methyl ester carboxylesterase
MKGLFRRLFGLTPEAPPAAPSPTPSFAPKPAPTAWVSRTWTSADGLILHARDYAPAAGAAKTPILCLHGLTRNASDFELLAPRIAAAGRRVLAVDFRGRGRSAWDPEPMRYLPATYAADILALLDQAGIARAGFIGTSLGGIVSMLLASLRPTAVAGVTLNDVGATLNPTGLARIGGYLGVDARVSSWAEAAQYAAKLNATAFPSYGAAQWDAFGRRLFEQTPEGGFRLAYDPAIAVPFKALDPSAPPADLTPLFAAMATGRPTLLVRGALSDLLDEGCVLAMRAMEPLMDYAEVPGVGHAPMLDEPEALAAIDGWLAKLP